MQRIEKWNDQKRNACLSEFRRLLKTGRQDQVENAIAAGRSLAKLMQDARVILTGIDDVQMERFRRRFAVAPNCKGIMYAVATGRLTDALLEERLNRKFPSYRLLSGKLRLVNRCPLCAKRTCRCAPVETQKKTRKVKQSRHPLIGKVVSLRGIRTAVKI